MRKPDYLGIISALIVSEQSFLKLQIGADIHKKGTTRLKYLKHRSIVTTLSLPPEKPTRTSSVIFDMTFMRSYSATDISTAWTAVALTSVYVSADTALICCCHSAISPGQLVKYRACGTSLTTIIVVIRIYSCSPVHSTLYRCQSSRLISRCRLCLNVSLTSCCHKNSLPCIKLEVAPIVESIGAK